jgi:hypothetical protein
MVGTESLIMSVPGEGALLYLSVVSAVISVRGVRL